MATRQHVNKQKLALSSALREQCRSGLLMPGAPAPPLRQLAEDYDISTRVAKEVVQELMGEGLFHMVPRVGTFVGRPRVLDAEFYLMLLPDQYGLSDKEDIRHIQHGFEERIAEKGSASIVMPLQRALSARASGELPPLVGLFDMAFHPELATESKAHASWGATDDLARVGFSGRIEDAATSDEISYDDEGGGRQAARHLLDLGHRAIAFLALHPCQEKWGELIWSRQRQQGWRQTLRAADLDENGLAFYPQNGQTCAHEQARAGYQLGGQILARPEITAVVAANDFAATGFLDAARASGLARERWPSVVGFDNRATDNGHLLTSLRLPAEQLGRQAADLLWERRHRQLSGAPVHRRVAMRLISRLTSRRDFSPGAANTLAASAQPNLACG